MIEPFYKHFVEVDLPALAALNPERIESIRQIGDNDGPLLEVTMCSGDKFKARASYSEFMAHVQAVLGERWRP